MVVSSNLTAGAIKSFYIWRRSRPVRRPPGALRLTGTINRPCLLEAELREGVDEELEQEIDGSRLPPRLLVVGEAHNVTSIDRTLYLREILRMRAELVKMRD